VPPDVVAEKQFLAVHQRRILVRPRETSASLPSGSTSTIAQAVRRTSRGRPCLKVLPPSVWRTRRDRGDRGGMVALFLAALAAYDLRITSYDWRGARVVANGPFGLSGASERSRGFRAAASTSNRRDPSALALRLLTYSRMVLGRGALHGQRIDRRLVGVVAIVQGRDARRGISHGAEIASPPSASIASAADLTIPRRERAGAEQ